MLLFLILHCPSLQSRDIKTQLTNIQFGDHRFPTMVVLRRNGTLLANPTTLVLGLLLGMLAASLSSHPSSFKVSRHSDDAAETGVSLAPSLDMYLDS